MASEEETPEVAAPKRYRGWIPTIDGGAVRAERVEAVIPSVDGVLLRTVTGNEYVAADVLDDVLTDLADHEPVGPPVKPPGKKV